jgi:hypothetical protein
MSNSTIMRGRVRGSDGKPLNGLYADITVDADGNLGVSGGGGGSTADSSAANQATQITLANSANNTLTDILAELRDDVVFAELLLRDRVTGAFVVRQTLINQDTGARTITWNNIDGTVATPTVANLELAVSNKDFEIGQIQYRANSGGIGYVVTDLILQITVVDTSNNTVALIWYNARARQVLTAAPSNSTLDIVDSPQITAIATNTLNTYNELQGLRVQIPTADSLLTELRTVNDSVNPYNWDVGRQFVVYHVLTAAHTTIGLINEDALTFIYDVNTRTLLPLNAADVIQLNNWSSLGASDNQVKYNLDPISLAIAQGSRRDDLMAVQRREVVGTNPYGLTIGNFYHFILLRQKETTRDPDVAAPAYRLASGIITGITVPGATVIPAGAIWDSNVAWLDAFTTETVRPVEINPMDLAILDTLQNSGSGALDADMLDNLQRIAGSEGRVNIIDYDVTGSAPYGWVISTQVRVHLYYINSAVANGTPDVIHICNTNNAPFQSNYLNPATYIDPVTAGWAAQTGNSSKLAVMSPELGEAMQILRRQDAARYQSGLNIAAPPPLYGPLVMGNDINDTTIKPIQLNDGALRVRIAGSETASLQGQILGQSSGNLTTANNTLTASSGIGSAQKITVQLTGTWTGTINFETSTDGVNWFAISMENLITGDFVTTTTTNGYFVGFSAGSNFRLRTGPTWSGSAAFRSDYWTTHYTPTTAVANQMARIGARDEVAPNTDTDPSGLNGRLQRIAQNQISRFSVNTLNTTITSGGAAQNVLAGNLTRKYLIILNRSGADLWVRLDGVAGLNSGIPIVSGGNYEFITSVPTQPLSVFGATTGQQFIVMEGI